ncbi:hypothetical protein BDZ91DRAFT_799923 [Kalaharituber pfeilii]|nr:hypothetical protein BDZ91DRAFT_799923 [Kalaharituber pfeilii]
MSSDTEPVSSEEDESYRNLTRRELMAKYNFMAEMYANYTDRGRIHDGQPDLKFTVRYSSFGIEELAFYRWRLRGEYSTDKQQGEWVFRWTQLVIDGTWYPKHPYDQIPRAVVNVPVHFNEHGREFDSLLVAGVMGFDVKQVPKLNDNEAEPAATIATKIQSHRKVHRTGKSIEVCDKLDAWPIFESALKPRAGWWIYEMRTPEEVAARAQNREASERESNGT